MITDLVQIRRLGENKRSENQRLRVHLKTHQYVERRLKKIGEEIQDAIDCRQCANCCREATVRLSPRDVSNVASFMGMREEEFGERYTMLDESGERILKRTAAGCVFLNGNDCTIYEGRPRTCELFPHIVKGDGPISTRMWQMTDRATYCPIVYNSLEAFKDETKFRR
jgi:Fe-S-cluster containining protein